MDNIIPRDYLKNIHNSIPIEKIMLCNRFEKIVPYSLWFHDHNYKIIDNFEHEQHLRLRYFKDNLLTPIVNVNDTKLQYIEEFLKKMSLYQPYYPESFYSIWEILSNQSIFEKDDKISCLFIGREYRLGNMEAVMMYTEMNCINYQSANYHTWIISNEMIKNNIIFFKKPETFYLQQTFLAENLQDNRLIEKYGLIIIDTNHLMENIYQWNMEEQDLHTVLFYASEAINYLAENGILVIRMSLLGSSTWNILLDFLSMFFAEHKFYRPVITNPYNPEIYLIVRSVGSHQHSTKYMFMRKYIQQYYVSKYYLFDKIIFDLSIKNSISKSFKKEVEKWSGSLQNTKVIEDITWLDKWHKEFDLPQIGDMDMYKTINHEPEIDSMEKSDAQVIICSIKSISLKKSKFYRDLWNKKTQLNFYKRVMDTKPSRIFMQNKLYGNREDFRFISWENLTFNVDVYHDLKRILRKEFNINIVTNAWMKMIEMLTCIPDILPQKKYINAFHICEAPGAFIMACRQYFESKKIKYNWHAQTLNPDMSEEAEALDDHFGIINENQDRWIYGNIYDESGDITHSEVIKFYAKSPKLDGINFMTADAGLACHPSQINEQESYLAKISLGQVICIFACLVPNGTAIMKTFLPLTTPLNISIINLLTRLFNNIRFYKPETSHANNSEIYIILNEYRGIDSKTLGKLYKILDDPTLSPETFIVNKLDSNFTKRYVQIIGNLIDRQIASLCHNYYYYYHYDEIKLLNNDIIKATEVWLDRTKMKNITKKRTYSNY